MRKFSRFIYILVTSVLIFSMVATNISIVFADDSLLDDGIEQKDKASYDPDEASETEDDRSDTKTDEQASSDEKAEDTDKEASEQDDANDTNTSEDATTDDQLEDSKESDDGIASEADNEVKDEDSSDSNHEEDDQSGTEENDDEVQDSDEKVDSDDESNKVDKETDESDDKSDETGEETDSDDKLDEVDQETVGSEDESAKEEGARKAKVLKELKNKLNELKKLGQGDYSNGSWKKFTDAILQVDIVLSDESELTEATEEYLSDLLHDLEFNYANLETEKVDMYEIENLYDAFQAKYTDIDITTLMDFYEDGYYNVAMLEYIEQYISQADELATNRENQILIEFIKTLDLSLTEALERVENNDEAEEEKDALSKLIGVFDQLKDMNKKDYTDSSWNKFIAEMEKVDHLLADEAKLAEMSEASLLALLDSLESTVAQLEVGEKIDKLTVADAYDAFQQQFNDVDINALMDFYEDGYYNERMLQELEKYIASGEDDGTDEENERFLSFIITLGASLEEALENDQAGTKEEKDPLTKLTAVFEQLMDLEKGEYNDGSWKNFMDAIEEIAGVLNDEAELADASEEYLTDLLNELEAAYANLDTKEAKTSKVEEAFNAFNQKYENIDIVDFMDFYDDGYYNLAMLEYIEQYIAGGQAVATTEENENILAFLKALDSSLEKELAGLQAEEDKKKEPEETSKQETEKAKKTEKTEKMTPKKTQTEAHLIKDEAVQQTVAELVDKQERKAKVHKVSQPETKTKTFREVVITPIEEVWVSTTEAVDDFRTLYVLPNTATPYFKYMVAGGLMIVEGIFLFAYFRFFSFVRKRFGFF